MFLSTDDIEKRLPEIANSHYSELFTHRLKKAIDQKIRSLTVKKEKVFFADLKRKDYSLLKRIVFCKINDTAKLVRELENYPKAKYRKNKSDSKKFGDHILDVFNYKWFTDKKSKYNAYILAEKLGSDTCLYCNRNFTFTIRDGDHGIVRPEFDHFLPKSRFPYFSISFYNLVPSCHICNSNLKLAAEFDFRNFLHPYKNDFDSIMRFTVKFRAHGLSSRNIGSYGDLLKIFYGDLDFFDVALVPRYTSSSHLIKKAKGNIKAFYLENLYSRHKDIVAEIIQNAIIYNDTRIDEIYEKYLGSLFRDRNDILRLVTRNYAIGSEMKKRILSKLTKDVHEEFGVRY